MADIPFGDEVDGLDDWAAAHAIGEKVMEMADRVLIAEKIVPGAVAKWGFEMDGQLYQLELRVGQSGN